MSHQDDVFVKTFVGVLAGLVVFTVVIVTLANMVGGLKQQGVSGFSDASQSVEDRIKPVGEVRLVGQAEQQPVAAAAPAERSGKEIVNTVCTACHGTGVAGAPKIGDKGAWAPRIAQGMATLIDHATHGFKGMPAKGGMPSLSDEEVKKAVDYLVEQGGGAAGGGTPATAAASAAAPAQAAASDAGKKTYDTVCFACHGTGAAGAPKLGDKAAWAPRIAQGMDVLEQHALHGIRGMPPKGGRVDLPDDQIVAAMHYMVGNSQ